MRSSDQLRLFIAGDGSTIGKSTVCLGIIGSLLESGYNAEEIAYMKPATQCLDHELVEKFCEQMGIRCEIGPVIFHKTFTRQTINKKIDTKTLEKSVLRRFRELSKEKKVVIIDGVGYSSVGSIAGISNARIAKLLDAPVLFVTTEGIGNAIDSFRLHETYFASHKVKVIGVVVNNISRELLGRCRKYIPKYFKQNGSEDMLLGFIPKIPLKNQDKSTKPITREDEKSIANIIAAFQKEVDISFLMRILKNHSE